MNAFNFLNQKYLGNSIENIIWFFVILILGLILKRVFSKKFSRLLYIFFKQHGKIVGPEKIERIMTRPIELLFTIVFFFLAFHMLVFPPEWNMAPDNHFGFRLIISALLKSAIIISITWIILRTVDCIGLILLERARSTETLDDDQLVSFFKETIKVVITIVGFFVLIGVVFHLDIVSLVAGLGIGGLAIALAAKETLENLFGSFTIFLDKPFVTGDSVKVGDFEGKVEKVGFRSTRIRAVDKMIVTVPNKKMIDAELINETDRMVRRANFILTLNHESTEEQVRSILSDIRELLSNHSLIEKETIVVRFKSFSTIGLEIMVVYIVLSPEMNIFLEIQEELNFSIMNIIKKNNSSFAIPLFFKGDNNEKSIAPGYYKTLKAGK
jgi:MscS family membrane protein